MARGCVCPDCLHWLGPQTQQLTPRDLESEAKARRPEKCTWIYFSYYLGECETATARRCWTDRHAGEGGAQTDRYPAGIPRSDRRRVTSRRRLSKETSNLGAWFSQAPSPQLPPHTGLPDARLSPPRQNILVAPCAAARPGGTNSLHVAKRRRSTAGRRVTASARAGERRARRRRLSRLLTLPWRPPRRCQRATPVTVHSLKESRNILLDPAGPRGVTEALQRRRSRRRWKDLGIRLAYTL